MIFSVILSLYCFFVVFESFGILSRGGGYLSKLIPIGISLQNQILSLNRFVGFCIPPIIGLYVDLGASDKDVITLGVIGNLISFLLLVFLLFRINSVLSFFSCITVYLNENGYSLFRLMVNFKSINNNKIKREQNSQSKFIPKFVIAQLINTGLAMPSVFAVNILAMNIPQYSSAILQATTMLSGIGNLILNFYIIPKLAISECASSEFSAEDIYRSIYLGKVVGLGFVGPFVLFSFYCLNLN